jgi:nitroreductase
MIRFAPSALNLQPWKINVVTDQKVKEELNPAAFNQEQVTICSHLFVFCADPDYDSLISRLGMLLKKSGVPEETQKTVVGMAVQFTQTMSEDQKLA